jgi:malonyl-CoA O-methyltransferase
MSDAPAPLDKRAVRRAFDRAAATYDAAAVLQREVLGRMLERFDYLKLAPATVLDAGCGTGAALPALRSRYPRAQLVALDLALAMTSRAIARTPRWERWLGKAAGGACGDLEALPFRDSAFGLVWSNLTLQWCDPERAFAEVRRTLAPGGLFMFSTFGPDTLKELRAAFAAADGHAHVNRFIDMHDLGDLLVHAGLANPVMDMETITVTYADVTDVMRDLQAIGARNANADRPAGLTGRRALAAVRDGYERFRTEGRLPATFEVVYGHAWKPEPRKSATGRPVIDIKPR